MFFVNHKVAVLTTVIAEESAERYRNLTVCKAFSHAPGAVLGNAPALLLCKAGHDGNKQFALAVEGPDVLFLEIAFAASFFQPADGGKAVDRISGKAGHAFGNYQINLSCKGILDHLIEAVTVLGGGCAYALVRIQGYELPILPALDVVGVIITLCCVTGLLVFHIRGNTSVACDTALFTAVDGCCRKPADGSRYCGYIFRCHFSVLPS